MAIAWTKDAIARLQAEVDAMKGDEKRRLFKDVTGADIDGDPEIKVERRGGNMSFVFTITSSAGEVESAISQVGRSRNKPEPPDDSLTRV
jgi:hypothetical protein